MFVLVQRTLDVELHERIAYDPARRSFKGEGYAMVRAALGFVIGAAIWMPVFFVIAIGFSLVSP
ncbi:MAG TPA: hypothetical protein VE907_14585, partial [Gammaproteobacteria bacterium]|nr:hypothetical protein [Gammaproteobacteria bacterium]